MDTQEVVNELAGLTTVIAGPDPMHAAYLEGGRKEVGSALAIVAPSSVEEVLNVVEYVLSRDLRIVAQGARTGLVGASVPEVSDAHNTIIVSLERMRDDPVFNEADRRIVVSAGYHLSEVNAFLEPWGVCVAVDVSSDPMVGGMAATNIAGSRVVHYGDFRDQCLGIEVVTATDDPESRVYSTLSRPRKDNASIDFTPLFVGSFGTYGIITQVALATQPIITSTHRHSAWIPVEGLELSRVTSAIKKYSGEYLLACEFLSKESIEALMVSPEQQQSNIILPYTQDCVFFEVGSSIDDFNAYDYVVKVMGELVQQGIVDDAIPVEAEKSWDLRHRVSDAVREYGDILVGCDISVTCDQVGEVRARAREVVHQYDPALTICDFGHLGDGGFHMNVVVGSDSSDKWNAEKSLDVRKRVSEIAVSLGGSFSAEHGLGAFNKALVEPLTDPVARKYAQNAKKFFDPRNVLGHAGIQL